MLTKRICFFAFLFITSTSIVYADIENEEEIDIPDLNQDIIQASSDLSEEPNINSRAAIVIDRKTKTILYGKAETEKRKMASTTKIMTAMIVIENSNLDDIVTVSKKSAQTGGSRLGLKYGDTITVHDLLYGLLLRSGNDSAIALAEYIGGSVEEFASMMNKKAQELGLTNTHFVTPHGLDDDNHYTTAFDLAILTDYALNNKTFANYVATKSCTIYINGYPKNLTNTNELLGNLNGVYGVKTGFTNGANRCLVTACKRDNLDIICVVLGADTKKNRTQDSIKLIEYCFNTYQTINLKELATQKFNEWKETNSSYFKILKGCSENLEPNLSDFPSDNYPINKNYIDSIDFYIDCNFTFEAPVSFNTKLRSF